jgi:hypothetical protein
MNPLYLANSEFRALAVRVTTIAADFYEQLDEMRAYPRTTGAETSDAFDEPLPEVGAAWCGARRIGETFAAPHPCKSVVYESARPRSAVPAHLSKE